MKRTLLRIWYIITDPGNDRMMWVQNCYGHFKVLYPDGRHSVKMGYGACKNYASLFGGKVVDAF